MLVVATRSFYPRRDLLLENLALRQQLAMLKGRRPRARLAVTDKWFWVMLRRLWPAWRQALMLVQPETVVRWHRARFKLYWQWLSRHRNAAGRRCVKQGVASTYLSHGGREPDLGRATHSWRAEDARLRHLGEDRTALDAEGVEKLGAGEAMDRVPE